MGYFFLSLGVFTTIALAVEAVFTSVGFQILAACRRQKIDWTMPSQTSIWALPVYGLSAAASFWFMAEFAPWFFGLAWPLRGLVYMLGIYAFELIWGWLIDALTGRCPWEYYRTGPRIFRYINPYYAIFWFGFGFLLERIHLYLIPQMAPLFLN